MEQGQYFAETGYAKLQLLGSDYCKFLSRYYWNNTSLHQRWPDLPGIKRTSVNDLPLMNALQVGLTPLIESIVGESIQPTYTFTSAYERGSCLPAHTDRPECRYNVTLMLDAEPDPDLMVRWPLFIRHLDHVHRVHLAAGEAVVYSGTQDMHWRDTMPEQLSAVLGVFLHYVTRPPKP